MTPGGMTPKHSGGVRLIVDLRPFNECNVEYPTEFDTLHTLQRDLQPLDLMSTFDLADGYFHLGIHPAYQQYFGFRVNGKRYRMLAIPFGWSCSPQAFMQITIPTQSMRTGTQLFALLRLYCFCACLSLHCIFNTYSIYLHGIIMATTC
jgi:hypothetical protein